MVVYKRPGDGVTVLVTVKNVGDVASDFIVDAYIVNPSTGTKYRGPDEYASGSPLNPGETKVWGFSIAMPNDPGATDVWAVVKDPNTEEPITPEYKTQGILSLSMARAEIVSVEVS